MHFAVHCFVVFLEPIVKAFLQLFLKVIFLGWVDLNGTLQLIQ